MKRRSSVAWPLTTLAVMVIALAGCANMADYPDLPLSDTMSYDDTPRIVSLSFLVGSATLDAESASRVASLGVVMRALNTTEVIAAGGDVPADLLQARLDVVAIHLGGNGVRLAATQAGLGTDVLVLTVIPARSGRLACQDAMSPPRGRMLGFVAPRCAVVEALNANIADPTDLVSGVHPAPGLAISTSAAARGRWRGPPGRSPSRSSRGR